MTILHSVESKLLTFFWCSVTIQTFFHGCAPCKDILKTSATLDFWLIEYWIITNLIVSLKFALMILSYIGKNKVWNFSANQSGFWWRSFQPMKQQIYRWKRPANIMSTCLIQVKEFDVNANSSECLWCRQGIQEVTTLY